MAKRIRSNHRKASKDLNILRRLFFYAPSWIKIRGKLRMAKRVVSIQDLGEKTMDKPWKEAMLYK